MLTFEKIRELERAERENKKLHKLPEGLLEELQDYLKKKEKLKQTSSDINELDNVKSTIKRFFEHREKKLIDAALYMAKTGLPAENATAEEERLIFTLVDSISKYRQKFFEDMHRQEPVQEPKKLVYKVKTSMPAFVGPDMNTYKLVENETIDPESIPKPLNEFLLKKGIIELVEE